eukprot:2137233-Pyramimonas_sp.AAC.1
MYQAFNCAPGHTSRSARPAAGICECCDPLSETSSTLGSTASLGSPTRSPGPAFAASPGRCAVLLVHHGV